VYVGDTIYVKLTCKQKTAKEDREGQVPQGVVAWDVEVRNQTEELVATYTILTLVRRTTQTATDRVGEPAMAPVPEPGKSAPAV
jgi:oxepin-CoA hydrolase / 3-oxo-5,6-dehydrosuberyl-CoA semialdehyde dehydrogenase